MSLAHLDLEGRPLADGKPFGDTGPYVELRGQAEFSVRPEHPSNAAIVDLDLAPRDAQGCVHFSADVRILRPAEPSRGNHGLFLDVVNRGGSIQARMLEPGPMGPSTQLSEGFLLRRGFTVVSCGWQHDIPRGVRPKPMSADALSRPYSVQQICLGRRPKKADNASNTQWAAFLGNGRFGLTAPLATRGGAALCGAVSTLRTIDAPTDVLALDSNYVPLDPEQATLAERDEQSEKIIPRDRWQFIDGFQVRYHDGFLPGSTYELTYTAVGAPVTGIGFLALRDLISHLRKSEALEFAIALGASQTGRLLRQMVYLGMCEDENGDLVLDGVLAIAAGARMTEANWRFGQPSAQGPKSAVFPFTDAIQTDPATGEADGLLRRALERHRVPKVIHLNTSSEYWRSAAIDHLSAARSHLTADGKTDVDVPESVRIYLCASTQHAPSPLPLGSSEVPTGRGIYFANTIDYKPFVRAAVDNLTAWVTRGTAPPPSRYPRLDTGTLEDERPTLDADGNEIAGIRHPDVSVPLATYTGWNPRHPETGAPHLLVRVTGATIPFAQTRDERLATGDPRPSIAERYSTREEFVAEVSTAAEALSAQRYLLAEDVAGLVAASAERWDQFTNLPRTIYAGVPNLTSPGVASGQRIADRIRRRP